MTARKEIDRSVVRRRADLRATGIPGQEAASSRLASRVNAPAAGPTA